MSGFDFTLIFCTLNRIDEVADFFSALKRDTPEDLTLQIIVVDQNREDKLSSILAEYRESWTIEHVRTEISGISPARNLVLDRIAGEFVAFPDDDCMYLDGTLRNVKRYFDLHPEADALLGVWSDVSAPAFSSADFEREVNRFTLFKRGEAFVQFYRKSVVDAVGAFDPDFGPGPLSRYPCGGDDSDYLLRAVLSGFKLRRVARIHVVHPLQNIHGFSAEKIAGYGFARMRLLRKHRMPKWFKLANLLFPLFQMVLHPVAAKYYFAMFRGRLRGCF